MMRNRKPPPSATRRQRGFTLLEALIAMLITAFGLLGLAGMQLQMSRNADVAKQRGEATRLAQEQVEALRSFTAIASAPGHANVWDNLSNGNDTITTNATYTRTWTLGGAVGDSMRRAAVVVGWSDRASEAQSVTLNTVISKTDPADIGALGFPLPQNTTLKRPKNRNMNIPVPAVDIGNGESLSKFSNFAIIFSNDTGYVIKRCTDPNASASDLTSCALYEAVLIAGYVSKTTASFPTGLGVNMGAITGYDSDRTIECSFDVARDQNNPDDRTNVLAGYMYYMCIVPMDTGDAWSGKVRLTGMSTGDNLLVCRMQFPDGHGVSANQRNVQPYDQVRDSLDSQNYVITSNGSCPTISGLATTLHQACRSSNPDRATDCPAS